jgi:RNA polymerase sigma-70 factor (ECF subfamily)
MAGFADIELPDAVAHGVIAGERTAVADAYRLLAQAVMNLAARILQDRHQAEEVVQDTFIDLVEKSAQIKNAHSIVAWVRKVAVNHCLMRLRSPWHARRSDVDALEALAERQVDSSMEWIEQVPTLEQALASLTEEARVVVWLHDVEGFTHKEIGKTMGKTASYSKSQLARAYEKLLQWQTRMDAANQTASALPHEQQMKQQSQDQDHGQNNVGNIGSPCPS